MKISAVSYTFNDARLLHGLLAEIPGWTCQADEIVIVDDGSDVPFSVLPAELDLPIRVIHNEKNRGFAAAKQIGISSTRHDLVFSLDCDSRVSPGYLEVCRDTLLRDASLGMVAGASLYDSGTDIISRYQKLFGDNYHLGVHGPVDFIPGHAFALRRKAWEDAGGFGSHTRSVCEDHALCANLRRAGYGLFIHNAILTRQIRKLSRHAHCKRLWSWLREEILARLQTNGPSAEQLAGLFIPPMLQRLPLIAKVNDPDLLYPELLCLASHCLHALSEAPVRESHDSRAMPESFCAALFVWTRPYVKLHTLLRADLAQLGFAKAVLTAGKRPQPDAVADWQPVMDVFARWEEEGILRALDQVIVPDFLEEDSSIRPDFSSYAETF